MKRANQPRFTAIRMEPGFSLLELALCLAFLATLAAIALPSFLQTLEKRRLSHDAENLLSFIQHMQSESIKRNEVITLSYARGEEDSWCIGAVLGNAACDCAIVDSESSSYCALDSRPNLIQSPGSPFSSRLSAASGDGMLRLDPVRGMSLDMADSLALDLRSRSETYRMQLNISATGLSELCSPDAAHQVPGYDICL